MIFNLTYKTVCIIKIYVKKLKIMRLITEKISKYSMEGSRDYSAF